MAVQGKSFQTSMSLHDLDRVNDAQKERHNAIARERGPDAYHAERTAAYTLRWNEALVYVNDGATLLDIGGGWTPQSILQTLIHDHRLNYYYADIDQRSVDYIAGELTRANLNPGHAVKTDNTVIPFPDSNFDVVFSSHCLEHSLDLPTSLSAIRRTLRPGGVLFMAVVYPKNWTGPYVREAESLKRSEQRSQPYGNRATTA